MPNPGARAQRYRERAEECRKLASLATSEATRSEFEELARCYDEIAEAELRITGTPKPISTG